MWAWNMSDQGGGARRAREAEGRGGSPGRASAGGRAREGQGGGCFSATATEDVGRDILVSLQDK